MLRGRNLKPTDRVTDDRDRALFAFPNSAAADFKVEEEEGEVQAGWKCTLGPCRFSFVRSPIEQTR